MRGQASIGWTFFGTGLVWLIAYSTYFYPRQHEAQNCLHPGPFGPIAHCFQFGFWVSLPVVWPGLILLLAGGALLLVLLALRMRRKPRGSPSSAEPEEFTAPTRRPS
jgi:hypothetical protein